MEEEFVALHQVRAKTKETKDGNKRDGNREQDDETLLANLKGSPLGVGTLEEIIDDDHAIVSSTSGPEYYVPIMSFVDKELLEPGCSVLLHQKVMPLRVSYCRVWRLLGYWQMTLTLLFQ
jgi:26S proteasome regulatory subunit T2